jgi:hypothetical protein
LFRAKIVTRAEHSSHPIAKRIATAVVLIPIVMAIVLRAPVPVVAVVAAAIVALRHSQEFLKLTESYGVQPLRLPTYIFVTDYFFSLLAMQVRPAKLPNSLQ